MIAGAHQEQAKVVTLPHGRLGPQRFQQAVGEAQGGEGRLDLSLTGGTKACRLYRGRITSYNVCYTKLLRTYWAPDYAPKDTDLLACFKITPQQGVPREEAAAAWWPVWPWR